MEPPPSVAKEGSAFGRMFNVLAAPGEVYQEIKEQPVNHANWIVPAIVWALTGITCILLLFSQDWAMYEIRKGQQKAMDQQVRAGKMSQQQADQAAQFMERFMPIMVKVGGAVTILIMAFGLPFFWGFVIWLVGVRALKADFEYMKGVEAAGLANIIYAVAGIIGTLISMAMGRFVYLSAAFSLKEFDFTSKQHFALAAINPLYLWFAAVIATAVAVFCGASWGKAAAWVLGIWIISRAILIVINLGQFTM
ncbi:MAG TPA: YIP1 family protein [Verrucomicrobiae bacterium]|nr:YIP1 family protein [Verrucomicrobiae bacterium]